MKPGLRGAGGKQASWCKGAAVVFFSIGLSACAGSSDPWWDSQYDYRSDGGVSSRSAAATSVQRPRVRPQARVQNTTFRQTSRPAQQTSRPTARPQQTASRGGCTHSVKRGETVYSISTQHRVEQSALRSANAIGSGNALSVGQCLSIPGRDTGTQVVRAEPRGAQGAAAPTPRVKPQIGLPPPATGQFIWPAEGRIISRYGPKEGGLHNDGINIAVPEGTSVMAAQSGVVAYAGNELRGYGNLLLVRHSNGWMTAYAHNGELLVSRGDMVSKGQTIATAGRTGSVQTPQIHFEIRRGSEAIDPLKVMAG